MASTLSIPDAAITREGIPFSTPKLSFWSKISDETTTAGETAAITNLKILLQ